MPCYDDRDSPSHLNEEIARLEDKINRLEAVLCGLITAHAGSSPYVKEGLFKNFDFEEAGVDWNWIWSWYLNHRKQDLRRKAAEVARKVERDRHNYAVDKLNRALTTQEIAILGLSSLKKK